MKNILAEASTYKKIYKNLPEYYNLRDNDQIFFDNLFIILLFDDATNYTNKYLSKRLNIPISTLEKRIKRLDKAGLIQRIDGVPIKVGEEWIKEGRILQLDPLTFSCIKDKLQENSLEHKDQPASDNKAVKKKYKVVNINYD